MPVNFPNSPTIGELFVTSGKTYQWDGEKWTTDTTVTKTDIGLQNVQNYSVATQAEAEAGTLDNLYMTPLKTKQAIAALERTSADTVTNENDAVGAPALLKIWQGNQSQYDALGTYEDDTLYFVTEV